VNAGSKSGEQDFSEQEQILFERRFEEGFDITSDERYNTWLAQFHPDYARGKTSVMPKQTSTAGKCIICASIHCILLCGYSCAGVSITGRAAKCVRTALDSSIEEESVAQVSSWTGETSLMSVSVCGRKLC